MKKGGNGSAYRHYQYKDMKNIKSFLSDESGMGVVEILLITVVLIAMVLIFQEKITSLVNKIWTSIGKSAKKIY